MQKETGKNGTGIVATHRVDSLVALKADAQLKDTKQLKDELAALLGFTAQNLLKLAIVVNELESRGEDLKSLRIGLLPILRKIAAGEILPDIVVLYAGEPRLLKRIASMPVEKQQDIVTNKISLEPVPRRQSRIHDDSGESQIDLDGVAKMAMPKDIGEMAFNLIARCQKPKIAMKTFVKIAARKKMLPMEVDGMIKEWEQEE